jgi:hypothetical protein
MTFRLFLGNITTERDSYYAKAKVIHRPPHKRFPFPMPAGPNRDPRSDEATSATGFQESCGEKRRQ